MGKKTVNVTFQEVMPVYEEILDFLLNKYGNNPPMDCRFTPQKLTLLLGAIKLTERFLMEEIKEINGNVEMSLHDPLS